VRRYRAGRLRVAEGNNALGSPRAASAPTGRAVYGRLREAIGKRIFLSPPRDA